VDGFPVVVVGREWPGDRQRFALAHELGHLLLKGRLAEHLDEGKAGHPFASAFLAPALEVIKELGGTRTRLEPRELCGLKNAYGVSMVPWPFRARELGILTEKGYLWMVELFRSHGWHKEEPCKEYPQVKRQQFEHRVFHALAEDLVTEPKAAELVAIPLMDLHALRNMDRANASAHQ
jgi:Zn-dependent peptidase ImmA (M78 family)